MPVSILILLISVVALWLFGHQVVKRRFAILKTNLSETYGFAIAAPAEGDAPRLAALCVDLMRKEHSTLPFDALTPQEQKMVLHARAVEELPQWMSRYAALWLSPAHRMLVSQLRHIKASRPEKPKQYFGAVKHQQRLRSGSES